MKEKYKYFLKRILYYIYGEKFFKRLKFADYFNNHIKFMNPIDHKELENIF